MSRASPPRLPVHRAVTASADATRGRGLPRATGDLDIRYADGTEFFTPSANPTPFENPKPGEIICTDADVVLTRHWNHRDAHQTRVTENSHHVAFVLETLHATRDGHLLKTAVVEPQDLLIPHAEGTTVHYLGPAQPEATA